MPALVILKMPGSEVSYNHRDGAAGEPSATSVSVGTVSSRDSSGHRLHNGTWPPFEPFAEL